jgi:hypothetical protein
MKRLLVALALVALAAGEAWAGACPVCDGPEDCPGGFCVLHDQDVGCGAMLQICCPGQGCAIGMDGRPTCETAGTCTVITGDAPDAAPPDAVPGAPDAAPGAPDASGTDGGDGGGCGCRVGARAPGGAGLAAAAALLLVLGRRRARARGHRGVRGGALS